MAIVLMLAAAALIVALIVGAILMALNRPSRVTQPDASQALDGLSRTLERMEQRLDKIETSVKQEQD